MGSLSHYINTRATGYEALPDFPEVPPPSEVRNVEPIAVAEEAKSLKSVSNLIVSYKEFSNNLFCSQFIELYLIINS